MISSPRYCGMLLSKLVSWTQVCSLRKSPQIISSVHICSLVLGFIKTKKKKKTWTQALCVFVSYCSRSLVKQPQSSTEPLSGVTLAQLCWDKPLDQLANTLKREQCLTKPWQKCVEKGLFCRSGRFFKHDSQEVVVRADVSFKKVHYSLQMSKCMVCRAQFILI